MYKEYSLMYTSLHPKKRGNKTKKKLTNGKQNPLGTKPRKPQPITSIHWDHLETKNTIKTTTTEDTTNN